MEEGALTAAPAIAVERLQMLAYEVPVDGPEGRESEGPLEWGGMTGQKVVKAKVREILPRHPGCDQ